MGESVPAERVRFGVGKAFLRKALDLALATLAPPREMCHCWEELFP